MNICMVLPHSNYVTTNTGAATPSGVFYVASALQNAGHEIYWLEFPNKRPEIDEIRDSFRSLTKERNIDIVMIGSLFGGWKEFRDICDGVKFKNDHVVVVGGGGLMTYSPNEAMEFCANCDIGVIGEGEITAVSLVKALEEDENLSLVKGIVFRDKDNLIYTGEGEIRVDLDLLPYPLISPVFEKSITMHKEISIVGARSCPFSCTFCSLSTTKNYRKRSIDNIIKEMKFYIKKYNVNRFLFMDELFADSVDRINEYIEKICPLNIKFFLQSRIDKNFTVDTFRELVNVGMYNFTLGVENINDLILKNMCKKTNAEMVNECLDNIEKADCADKFMLGYLMGDPAETIETAATSIMFFRNNFHRFKHFAFDLVNAYPGAKLYSDAVLAGKINPREYFEATYFTPPVINMTSLNFKQFSIMNYYIAYSRLEYAHNQNIEFDFYLENSETYFKYRCHCCEDNDFTSIALKNWIKDPNEVAIYLDSFRCEYCLDVMCNATLRLFYNKIGEYLVRYMNNHKCALRCYGIELMMFSKHIVNSEFMLIDRNIKYTGDDWEEFEKALGDTPIMSRILREHPAQKSLPIDADIDTVIVLIDYYYEDIKKEIESYRPDVNVIRYTEVILKV